MGAGSGTLLVEASWLWYTDGRKDWVMHPRKGRELGEKLWWVFWALVALAVIRWVIEALLERIGR